MAIAVRVSYPEDVDESGTGNDLPDDGIDVGLVCWMLDLSPSERLDVLQGFVDSIAELRHEDDDSQVP